MIDGLFWVLVGVIVICCLFIFRYMRRLARDAGRSREMAANPLMKVPAGLQVSPAITPGAVTSASAGMGGSSSANQAAHLQQVALNKLPSNGGGVSAGYAP